MRVAWVSQEMTRRESVSGRQATASQRPCSVIHSSTRARALARVIAEFGSAQVAQPAEAEQVLGPLVRGRHHLEDGAAVAHHDLAGEGEAPAIDLGGAGRIGGAEILRRDDDAVSLAQPTRPLQQRMAEHARDRMVEAAPQREPRQPAAVPQ